MEIFTPKDRAEWLKIRKDYVTATDWPKIKGLSKYGGQLDVKNDKLGYSVEKEMNKPMLVGTLLEPVIRTWFAERIGVPLDKWETTGEKIWLHPEFHAASTPDGIFPFNGKRLLFECKTHMATWEEIPEHVGGQVLFQGATTSVDEGYVVDVELYEHDYDKILMAHAQGLPLELPREPQLKGFVLPAEAFQEILEEANEWYEEHVILGLDCPEQMEPVKATSKERVKVEDELILTWQKAKADEAKAKKEMEDYARVRSDTQDRLARLLSGRTGTFAGAGLELTKTWVNGSLDVDYETIVKLIVQAHPELKAEVDRYEQAHHKFGAGHSRWSLKDPSEVKPKKGAKKGAEKEVTA